jgi:alpha-1,3-rhamnosyl/mannosyltransferase
MRVILNGVSALKPKTGVGHTTANLYRALGELPGDDAFWLYPGEKLGHLVRRFVGRPRTTSAGRKGSSPGRKSRFIDLAKAAYRMHFQTGARWGNFDLYHEPNFVPFRTHLPTVVTVHDLSVVLHPEWHPADRVAFHERHFHRGIAAADHVIVVSESIREEVMATLGLPADRVTAVHNGIGGQFRPQAPEVVEVVRRKLNLPPRYFLAVGTIEPRKNIATILRAFCDLPASIREACPLVLAGGWGWKSERERDLFESEARHRGAIHLGYVDDADLPTIYSGAAALLYPSFYEGFGLPPVEMLACGGSVIASTAAAVREVAGGHAVPLDPHDLDGWREAMRRAVAEPDWLDSTRSGGQAHASQFTWEAAAQKTVAVYRQVLGLGAASVVPASYRAAA